MGTMRFEVAQQRREERKRPRGVSRSLEEGAYTRRMRKS
jgi:hypothetical protein